MKIHLLRSPELDAELFENVFEIVDKYSSPMKFLMHDSPSAFLDKEIIKEDFEKSQFRKKNSLSNTMFPETAFSMYLSLNEWRPEYPEKIEKVNWEAIFERCNTFRLQQDLSTFDRVFLLTDYSNDKNWFSAWDPKRSENAFVHAAQWEYFVPSDPRFPIAYEVMVVALQSIMFNTYAEAKLYFHKKPRGCVNDFCKDKNDIALKLRTADICPNCQTLLLERAVDPLMSRQIFQTLDDIRANMLFRERIKTTMQPSRLQISGKDKKIFFSDLAGTELKLGPLEKIVYLLFLEHPEGLHFTELSDHKERLTQLYKETGFARTVPELHNSISQLIDPTENSLSEKISRIKRKIVSVLGPDLAGYYIIDGERDGKKKILLDRRLLLNED
ncbi:MAG: hypothetical protein EYC69_01265 [Bacteroidetes bacterium]|nr:MAG: hypothetical protein EYC69_01265 [Bacteroidota bacterium]